MLANTTVIRFIAKQRDGEKEHRRTDLSAFSSDFIAARVALIASCIASPAQRDG